MKIIKALFGFIDIFTGEGWGNHSRYKRINTSKGIVYNYISGIKLPVHIEHRMRNEIK